MINYKNDNYNPDYIVPPGATLEETLGKLHMSQAELAIRIARPEKTISEIINGFTAITPETAIQLERAIGITAAFWNNLEKNYQEQKAKLEARKGLTSEIELLKDFPYNIMAKYGWIKGTLEKELRVENLLSYFGVNSLRLVPDVLQVNYRKHAGKNISHGAAAAWLRKGEIDSVGVESSLFDEKKLRSHLNEFKALSKLPIQEFAPRLQATLAECGVVLIFTPGLPKTYICGATRWLSPTKALIQLSIRGGYADIMWFTLYHELAHVILHSKRDGFIDMDDKVKENQDDIELSADGFSSEMLISSEAYKNFLHRNLITKNNVMKFAEALDVHPGIVVGRLQHDQVISFSKYSELRPRYVWNLD